ncbi:MAG: cell division protein [Pusillimonas sp.]|jgi:protein ImuA|nr:cell division protein [Pusillimonas sp.]
MNSTSSSHTDCINIHPALWRASQLAQGRQHVVPTGYAVLNRELPSGGWPNSTFIEILPAEIGTGEISLLMPALKQAVHNNQRRIIFLNCPLVPNALCWLNWQLNPNNLVWVHPKQSNQVLWATEQILRHDAGAALLVWLPLNMPLAAMRKLHLAAQRSTSLFFGIAETAHQHRSSPAPLRLGLKGAPGGIHINIIKRQGPTHAGPLFIPLAFKEKSHFAFERKAPQPHQASNHVLLDQPLYTT